MLLLLEQSGFNLVFGHGQAINCICLALKHNSPRCVRSFVTSDNDDLLCDD